MPPRSGAPHGLERHGCTSPQACAHRRPAGLIAGCGLALVLSGCTLFSPTCRNRDVKASIERDALATLQSWRTVQMKGDFPFVPRALELQDTYESKASGDTRSCAGRLKAIDGGLDLSVPIAYTVAKNENGQPLYGFDANAFAGTFIQLASVEAYTQLLQAKRNEPQPATPPAPQPPSEVAPGAEAPTNATKQWENSVRKLVASEMSKLAERPSGSQVFVFTVTDEGRVVEVHVLGSIVKTPAAEQATALLKSLQLPKPPNGRTSKVALDLMFVGAKRRRKRSLL